MIDILKDTIDSFQIGFVFTADDFSMTVRNSSAVSRSLNALVAKGYLRRLSKGRFYKPQISKFGELSPDTYQVVKDLLKKDGKLIGYITGYSAFNDFALTTQVSAILEIGMRKEKKAIVRGIYRIRFMRQENTITKENIPFLRLLDCLRFLKNIPDTTPDHACQRLIYLIKKLDEQEISKIKKLALKYTPQAIALLGAILEAINPQEDTAMLFKKLNPITVYKLGISDTILPTQKKWNIQ
ncbi:hypothetical protein FACS1894201_06000 [Bacteroidia bacterium]|nr:hypothetical protein FACS1894201_06000 [Bacteroidia bacterium]